MLSPTPTGSTRSLSPGLLRKGSETKTHSQPAWRFAAQAKARHRIEARGPQSPHGFQAKASALRRILSTPKAVDFVGWSAQSRGHLLCNECRYVSSSRIGFFDSLPFNSEFGLLLLDAEALDHAVALALLVLEVICWLLEKWTGCVAGWHLYHRIVSHLLFKLFFREVSVDDPHRVLKMAGNQRLIFCSNHPTGLLDRLLIQYLSPRPCFCLTQNWFSHHEVRRKMLKVLQATVLNGTYGTKFSGGLMILLK